MPERSVCVHLFKRFFLRFAFCYEQSISNKHELHFWTSMLVRGSFATQEYASMLFISFSEMLGSTLTHSSKYCSHFNSSVCLKSGRFCVYS